MSFSKKNENSKNKNEWKNIIPNAPLTFFLYINFWTNMNLTIFFYLKKHLSYRSSIFLKNQ
jgi:hypothetical protein